MPTVLDNVTTDDVAELRHQVENAELLAAGLRGRVAFLEKQVADLRKSLATTRRQLGCPLD